MNKKISEKLRNVITVIIALLIINTIILTTIAKTVEQVSTLGQLIDCTREDSWYDFDPVSQLNKSISSSDSTFNKAGGYCVDPHSRAFVGTYKIVNVIDINNNTSANSVRIYGINKDGKTTDNEYSFSDPKVFPILMLAYLAEQGNNETVVYTSTCMTSSYKAAMAGVFLKQNYIDTMISAGVSDYLKPNKYFGYDETAWVKLGEAKRAATSLAAQGNLQTGSLTVSMSQEEKDKVAGHVGADGKYYVGPYKLNLKGGSKVESVIAKNGGTDLKVLGISTDITKTPESPDTIVDNTEFYVVLDQETEITSIKVTGKNQVDSIKARLVFVSGGASQNFHVYRAESTEQNQSTELEVPKFGKLQIEKVDEFKNTDLVEDIGFVVWSESKKAFIKVDNGVISYEDFETAKANEFKTDKYGKTQTIEKLPLGKYKVYETSIPKNLKDYYELSKMELKDKDNKKINVEAELKGEVDISSGQTVTVTAENERDFIAKFYIIKRDKDTRELLNGIEFKMFKVSADGTEKHWVVFDKNNEVTSTDGTWDEASSLVTVNGRTPTITKLPIGKYMIFETGVGDNDEYKIGTYRMNGGLIPGTLIDQKELKANETGTTYIEEENEQVYIDISGKVWEDTENDKNAQNRNDTLGSEDNRINGIEVRLMDSSTGKAVQTTKTQYDKESKENGVYRFKQVEIANLANLYVEFTYDGVTYQSVAKTGTADNESKATETDSRKTVNNKFKELTGEGQKFATGETLTYTKSVTEQNDIVVKSNNIGDRTLNEDKKLITMTKQGDFTVDSKTEDNYLADKYKKEKNNDTSKKVKEITNVNLGVYIRVNPDVKLVKSLENAQVSINGKKYTYSYAKDGDTRVTLGVKFEDLARQVYNLPMYRADVAADLDQSRELKVSITYKIQLANDSPILYAKINSLKDIYSSDMEFAKLYTLNADGSENVIYNNTQETTAGDYKTTTFNNLNIKLNPAGAQTIYVTYKLPKDKFTQTNGSKRTLYKDKEYRSYSEITSYTTYSDKFKSLYAGFDINSIPNNFDVNKAEETFENDTGVAGGLRLVDAGERKTTGVVFEDSDTDANDNQRIGDSKYSENENKVSNAKVNFIDVNTNEIVATTTTNENGEYEISGFIPGDYKLEFVWGEGENTTINGKLVKLDKYKSTIWTSENLAEKAKTDWYKSQEPRYSDALDDYEIRKALDAKTKDLLKALENDDNTATMKSTTKNIDVGIEKEQYDEILEGTKTHYEFNINNIDFGIIERPIQSMEIVKAVDSIQVTTARGDSLVDVKINDKGELEGETKGVTGGPNFGFIKVEMDTDLLSGSTAKVGYKIKVKNTSEKDYDSEEYYLYGKEDESKLITQTVDGIYDYLSGISPEINANKDWTVVPAGDVLNTVKTTVIDKVVETSRQSSTSVTTDEENKITKWVLEEMSEKTEKLIEEWAEEMIVKGATYRDVKYSDKVISINALSNIELGVGEEKEFSFYSNRLLAASDEILFENDAEITDVIRKSNTGRKVSLEHSDLYNYAELVTITPPTGEDRDFTPVMIITISSIISIAVLGAGIVIIKKKVLKK